MDPETSIDGLPRFSPVAFNDHAGQLWIVSILSLIYTVLVVTARAYIKYKMFGFDDILIALALVFHLAQSIALFVGLDSGLGKFNSITPMEQLATSSKSTLAAVILGLLALSLAKCSLLGLILRIIGSRSGKIRPFCIGLMILSGAWGIGSCVVLLVKCRADTTLSLDNLKKCPDQNKRWAVITAIDIFTEILTWLLTVRLSWTVNMSVTHKCQVVMAFSFRIPLIALSVCHLAYFSKYPTSAEPQFAVTNSLLFQQAMIAWSLISATVPNLRNFLKSFSIGMGFPLPVDASIYGSNTVYALRSLENTHPQVTPSAAAAPTAGMVASTFVSIHGHSDSDPRAQPRNWRPDQVLNQNRVSHYFHNNNRDSSLGIEEDFRTGSREMIIQKEVAWSITYGDHH
ncbi:hypothetical protein BGZ63DRAFT_455119 [Mariannaea sp. PMI_226]|nr:hypothetical protein BGZ63DRAFT_455119 [Mariannaea sp. PMI_226]